MIGLEIVQATIENVKLINENLKIAQDRQKSYVEKWRREMKFDVKDKVFLKLLPWKGILWFG